MDSSDTVRLDIIMVKEVTTTHKFGDKPYLGFEHVTMVPMCRKLIDVSLLSGEEKEFINAFHVEVEKKTKSFFDGDDLTLKWLHRETRPL